MINVIGEINAALAEEFLNSKARFAGGTDTVLISSPGGDIGYMLAMFDTISRKGCNTLSTGIVQSAAAVLSQAGAVRLATSNTLFRFMKPEPSPSTEEVDDLRWYLHSVSVNLVAKKMKVEAVIEAYDVFDNCFITAERALELNLIDQIVEG